MSQRLTVMSPQERQRLERQVETECRKLRLAIRRLIARWRVRRRPSILESLWNGLRLLFDRLWRILGLKR